MKTRWPKKQPLSDYIKLTYTEGGRCRSAVINGIKRGDLPGIKDGGKWFVYVLPDGSPAYGYSENQQQRDGTGERVSLTGNPIADAILAKTAANNGFKVA